MLYVNHNNFIAFILFQAKILTIIVHGIHGYESNKQSCKLLMQNTSRINSQHHKSNLHKKGSFINTLEYYNLFIIPMNKTFIIIENQIHN